MSTGILILVIGVIVFVVPTVISAIKKNKEKETKAEDDIKEG